MIVDYSVYQQIGALPDFNGLYFLYELCDPDTMEIRYIGKTNNIKKRYYNHISPCQLKARTHKNSWIKSLLSDNKKPVLRIVVMHKDADKINKIEIQKIKEYKELGFRLTNGTNGGDGQCNMTEETRLKIIEGIKSSNKKRYPHSEETKKKISKSQIGKNKPKWNENKYLKMCKPVIGTNILTEEQYVFTSARNAEKFLNCKFGNVSRKCRSVNKQYLGYTWEYKK